MEDESPDITTLARLAAAGEDPEAALRALTDLREELSRLEAEHVSRALGRGATWSRIADALGVSKQAAHKRHRHRRERGEKVRISDRARMAIAHGRQEAIAAGARTIGSDHLLLGVIAMRDTRASRALQGLGATTESLRAVVGRVDPGGGDSPSGLSAEARRALERSLRSASSLGRHGIDTESLVLALIEDRRGPAARVLEALGVSPQAVRELIA